MNEYKIIKTSDTILTQGLITDADGNKVNDPPPHNVTAIYRRVKICKGGRTFDVSLILPNPCSPELFAERLDSAAARLR